MVEIIGDKVVLKEATKEYVDELFYWKYEEKKTKRQKSGMVPTSLK